MLAEYQVECKCKYLPEAPLIIQTPTRRLPACTILRERTKVRLVAEEATRMKAVATQVIAVAMVDAVEEDGVITQRVVVEVVEVTTRG